MNMRQPRLFVVLLLVTGSLAHAQPAQSQPATPTGQVLAAMRRACRTVEQVLDERIVPSAEVVARRHLEGGLIGFPWNSQAVQQELAGRSGNMMHIGFDRAWTKDRTAEQKARDIAVISWERPPGKRDIDVLRRHDEQGHYIVAFGPRNDPAVADAVPLVDAWFDSGGRFGDPLVTLPGGIATGNHHLTVNTLMAWAWQAEVIAALTRQGRLPTIWKSFSYSDGREWMDRYFRKQQFHEDFQVEPIPAGMMARKFLAEIQALLDKLERDEAGDIGKAANLVAAEMAAGRKAVVAPIGHMPWTYVGRLGDDVWMQSLDFHGNAPKQMAAFREKSGRNALVIVLGYSGLDANAVQLLQELEHRVVMITTANEEPGYRLPDDLKPVLMIDMGWAFGDALITLPGYPIRVLPPSGIMQVAVYEAINAEVLTRLAAQPAN
jgi:hypothetical protein